MGRPEPVVEQEHGWVEAVAELLHADLLVAEEGGQGPPVLPLHPAVEELGDAAEPGGRGGRVEGRAGRRGGGPGALPGEVLLHEGRLHPEVVAPQDGRGQAILDRWVVSRQGV